LHAASVKSDRDQLLESYRQTRCSVLVAAKWLSLDDAPTPHFGLIVTAWNPASRRLPDDVNARRDRLLRAELDALGVGALRARGTSADGTWFEDGWLIAHEAHRSLSLLRRYGQLAGFVFSAEGRGLLWADGTFRPL
jgi:hypothetical protein